MLRWQRVYRRVRDGQYSRNRTYEKHKTKIWRNRDSNRQLNVMVVDNVPAAIIETQDDNIIYEDYDGTILIFGTHINIRDALYILGEWYDLHKQAFIWQSFDYQKARNAFHASQDILNLFIEMFPLATRVYLQHMLDSKMHDLFEDRSELMFLLQELHELHPNLTHIDNRIFEEQATIIDDTDLQVDIED